jgi:hypothetical protein
MLRFTLTLSLVKLLGNVLELVSVHESSARSVITIEGLAICRWPQQLLSVGNTLLAFSALSTHVGVRFGILRAVVMISSVF